MTVRCAVWKMSITTVGDAFDAVTKFLWTFGKKLCTAFDQDGYYGFRGDKIADFVSELV